ncbi:MAG: Uncharacterized proteins YbdD and YjiX [uncultured Lysobacter sp.]|uniref:Uncharacterized proteins YbdD and YjiX n=1 Tax=uncultured Lysobacter sp. TaxID=271060 RepID=A0A6J4KS55_9GAMM|nr:MAG: Uncharacterized proteins YbdD and YjiX [uncultured Lysobacter sp.]
MSRLKRHVDRVRHVLRLLMQVWQKSARTARLTIGIPDYDTYVAHVRAHHPEQTPMSRDAFFVERMDARYGRGRSRCC